MSAIVYGDSIDLSLNELQNFKVQSLAADPTNLEARLYYNSVSHVLRFYNGTAWNDLAAATYTDEQAQDAVATAFANGTNTVVTVTYNDASNSLSLTIGALQVTAAMIANATITDTQVAAANKDGAAGTASMRTLGFGAAQALSGTSRLDQIAAPTASVAMNSQKITGLLDPTAAQDAATKAYTDALAQGLAPKDSVRVATTAAGTLATSFENGDVVDGVTLATGDRILVKDQAAGAENGIRTVAASGTPPRALDADSSNDLRGATVWVEEGTVNADTGWVLVTNAPITVDTTALVFTQNSGLGQITAGAALTKTGSTLDVAVDTTTIEVNADALRIAAGAAGAGLTGGGGSALAVGAGTGIISNANDVAVDTAVVARMFKGALTGGAVSEVVTHSLGTRDIQVQCYNQNTPWNKIELTVEATSTTTITLRSGANLVAGTRVVVMG